MTVGELKEKLEHYDDDTTINIRIVIMNENSDIIDETQEKISHLIFEDYLGESEDILNISTYYTLLEEVKENDWRRIY